MPFVIAVGIPNCIGLNANVDGAVITNAESAINWFIFSVSLITVQFSKLFMYNSFFK